MTWAQLQGITTLTGYLKDKRSLWKPNCNGVAGGGCQHAMYWRCSNAPPKQHLPLTTTAIQGRGLPRGASKEALCYSCLPVGPGCKRRGFLNGTLPCCQYYAFWPTLAMLLPACLVLVLSKLWNLHLWSHCQPSLQAYPGRRIVIREASECVFVCLAGVLEPMPSTQPKGMSMASSLVACQGWFFSCFLTLLCLNGVLWMKGKYHLYRFNVMNSFSEQMTASVWGLFMAGKK